MTECPLANCIITVRILIFTADILLLSQKEDLAYCVLLDLVPFDMSGGCCALLNHQEEVRE
jgi:hypothetical protein